MSKQQVTQDEKFLRKYYNIPASKNHVSLTRDLAMLTAYKKEFPVSNDESKDKQISTQKDNIISLYNENESKKIEIENLNNQITELKLEIEKLNSVITQKSDSE